MRRDPVPPHDNLDLDEAYIRTPSKHAHTPLPASHCTALHCMAVSKQQKRQVEILHHQARKNNEQGSTPDVGGGSFSIYSNCTLHPTSLLRLLPCFPLRYTAAGTAGPCLHCIHRPCFSAHLHLAEYLSLLESCIA
jgi:hypothetical protein